MCVLVMCVVLLGIPRESCVPIGGLAKVGGLVDPLAGSLRGYFLVYEIGAYGHVWM